MAESVPETLVVPEPQVVVKEVIKEVPAKCDHTRSSEACEAKGPLQFVGGDTRIGIGIDTDLQLRGDLSHVFSETSDSATSATGWIGIDPTAEDDSLDPTLTGAGARVNHHWVSKDDSGNPTHVNKAFVGVDQNGKRRRKVTAGYGQENEKLFWGAYGSKSFGKDFHVQNVEGGEIVERAYDYGVGARVGTTLEESLVRVRGGVDYEWGTEYADHEEKPTQLTATAGVEKFFQDSPHSVSLNVSAYQKEGGKDGSLESSGTRANINYRYDLGNNVFRSDEMYRRVRVELPGEPRPPKYKKELVKNTMEMEADNFFNRDRHELTPKARTRLDTIISRIRGSGHVGNIRITGNTCNLGTQKHNQRLSERRAAAVKAYFVSKGFNPNILMTRGLGETKPKYPNTPQSGHKNRRVDIEYVSEQKKFKEIMVDPGGPGEPIVTWKQERCPTPPIWVQRALHNTIDYKTIVDDYQTFIASSPVAPIDSDGDGVTDDKDQCPNTPAGTPVDSTGCPMDDGDDGDNGDPNPPTTPENKPPVGTPDYFETWKNEPGGMKISPAALLANDTDPDGDAIQLVGIVQSPTHGSLVPHPDGGWVYHPRHNFCGKDSFTYTISDGKGGTDTVTAYIEVLETD
jgi:outer membrane protein OmpA-like peptidoglycan-associated protein